MFRQENYDNKNPAKAGFYKVKRYLFSNRL